VNVVVVLVTLLASVVGGWFAVSGVLALAARSKDSGEPEHGSGAAAAAATPGASATSRRELRGGTWIGVLERLAVTGVVLLGHPEGVAVVVAVKGLGRYPELARNPEVSERFVIGSLASLVWAVGLGAAGMALLT
jgi:hypothetical protein